MDGPTVEQVIPEVREATEVLVNPDDPPQRIRQEETEADEVSEKGDTTGHKTYADTDDPPQHIRQQQAAAAEVSEKRDTKGHKTYADNLIQLLNQFSRHDFEIMLLHAIEEGMFPPAGEGEGSGTEGWRAPGAPTEIGPINEERAALLVERYRSMRYRANTWQENGNAIRASTAFLSAVSEVILHETQGSASTNDSDG